ncbi:uncharacterized protein LOC120528189 isoform X1 [Polypterus senegalus]|uniref:uncharacterized protein LOC120528189 isoform X1 n=1 Tax=Polypterus senegalus TaxID=55291 RepID=UPI001962A940|nr:uncharacterized protein LOC120528189 isoform X1 [Polypterus senegalus]
MELLFGTFLFLAATSHNTNNAQPEKLWISAKTQENVTLCCAVQDPWEESSMVSWYRLVSGQRVQHVVNYIRQVRRVGRYSGELHFSNGTFALNIQNVERGDSGSYFCVVRAAQDIKAAASSVLEVKDVLVTATLQIFAPVHDVNDLKTTSSLKVYCVLRHSSPSWSLFEWIVDNITTQVNGVEMITTDGSHLAFSHFRISQKEWEKSDVTCLVRNSGESLKACLPKPFTGDGWKAWRVGCTSILYYGMPVLNIVLLLAVIVAFYYKKKLIAGSSQNIYIVGQHETEYSSVKFTKSSR